MVRPNRKSNYDFIIMWCMILATLIPIIGTMGTIEKPGIMYTAWHLNPTPYGYTCSLSLFLLPSLLIIHWFQRHKAHPVEFRAIVYTSIIILVAGGGLDLIFGHAFFKFPNPGATLGIRVPAYSFEWGWIWAYLPIEEFGFYLFGALYTLCLYAWSDLYWFKAYNVTNFKSVQHAPKRLIKPHWQSVITAAILIAIAIAIKKNYPHLHSDKLPGYAIFLILVALLPSMVLFSSAKPFINWRAFGFVNFNLMWLSFFWEASLASRFGWWRYKPDQMMGLLIHDFLYLPIEAVLLWVAIAWAIVIFYVIFCIVIYRKEAIEKGESPSDDTAPQQT